MSIGHPLPIANALFRGSLEGIHAQVFDQRHAQFLEGLNPDL